MENTEKQLSFLRSLIDNVDEELVSLFINRMAISQEIGAFKRQNGLPVTDSHREQEKIASLTSSAEEIYKPYVERLYREIFTLSKEIQNKNCHD